MGVGVLCLCCIDDCGDAAVEMCNGVPAQDAKLLANVAACVSKSAQEVLEMDSACEKFLCAPSHRVVSKIDIEYLREIHKKSKIFSSSFWNLKSKWHLLSKQMKTCLH